jgi:hypothetical protein
VKRREKNKYRGSTNPRLEKKKPVVVVREAWNGEGSD